MSATRTYNNRNGKVKQNSSSSHCRIIQIEIKKIEIMNITGRLTRNAEIRTAGNGKQVVNFSVAVNDNYKNKQGERVAQTCYFNCSYWRSPKVVKMLTKGLLVELTGRVSARAWVNKEGEAQAGLNFHTSDIKPLAGGKRAETVQANTEANKEEADDDLPF